MSNPIKNHQIIYRGSGRGRLDKFLTQSFPRLNRSDIQRLIKRGLVLVRGERVISPGSLIRPGDTIEIQKNSSSISVAPLEVVYDHLDFAIVEKPAGLPVYETKKDKSDSIVMRSIARYPQIIRVGEKDRPGIVHRLDKDTSGLMLIAKTEKGYEYLRKLFLEKQVEKEYQALVYGKTDSHGFIDSPLSKIGYEGQSRVRVASSGGRPAKTEYWTINHFARGVDFFSLIRVKLHTGRTHQIRVHFASIGHPVMGDKLYGKPNAGKLPELKRQFLHSYRLSFSEMDRTLVDVRSNLPHDLAAVLRGLKKEH